MQPQHWSDGDDGLPFAPSSGSGSVPTPTHMGPNSSSNNGSRQPARPGSFTTSPRVRCSRF
jgi:hypothetical protein